ATDGVTQRDTRNGGAHSVSMVLSRLIAAGIIDLPAPAEWQIEIQAEVITIGEFISRNTRRDLTREIIGDPQICRRAGRIIRIGGRYNIGPEFIAADTAAIKRRLHFLDPAIGIKTVGEEAHTGEQSLI